MDGCPRVSCIINTHGSVAGSLLQILYRVRHILFLAGVSSLSFQHSNFPPVLSYKDVTFFRGERNFQELNPSLSIFFFALPLSQSSSCKSLIACPFFRMGSNYSLTGREQRSIHRRYRCDAASFSGRPQ